MIGLMMVDPLSDNVTFLLLLHGNIVSLFFKSVQSFLTRKRILFAFLYLALFFISFLALYL